MGIRVAIHHKMHYDYDRFIEVSPQVIRLKPAPHSRTPIQAYSLKIAPADHFINWQQDPFGNYLARVVFPNKINHLYIDVEVIAEMIIINPFDFFLDTYAEKIPFVYEDQTAKELLPYFEIIDKDPQVLDLVDQIKTKLDRHTIDCLVEINQFISKLIGYTIRLEPGIQTSAETLTKKTGSCRDSAWLLVQVLRHIGLASRFVSGYLIQLKPDEKPLTGPAGPTEDFTDLHAWAEVYIPGAGWIGLDPTSGLFASEGHIPLTCTPHPVSAAPITGLIQKCETNFSFKNEITRIEESPRISFPITEDKWQKVNFLAAQIDRDLEEMDVRLTMGGEPTFISIDEMDAPEWNSTADGVHKQKLAAILLDKLYEFYGGNGIKHFGQGKLYPGESLPRWQYGVYWRKDGKEIWRNKELFASFDTKGNADIEDLKKFAQTISEVMNLENESIIPAFEDAFYFAWEEGKLPKDKDPLKSDLKDSLERRALIDVLNHGLANPVGYIIPIHYNYQIEEWETGEWNLKRKELYLIPGNSKIGYRLPLSSLPDNNKIHQFERDPFAPTDNLTEFEEQSIQSKKKKNHRKDITIKTALCLEIVNGHVYIFLPPQIKIEAYLELVGFIHKVSAKLKMPILLGGYEPPYDNRIEKILVTPDPGVIEVNIPPLKNWNEISTTIKGIYDLAKKSRLGAEKFMLDGRHTGSGGGNHITLGGISPADSPFIRRPSLLRSMITFWQHHPALSYLFSGSFIGPTSQAPRVDEGREDALYELDLAFSQIPDTMDPPHWLTDRILRNLLIDVSGNTHRSEFCIDKLYSPYGTNGRLGIIEFRGFEMPPHARMSALQYMLIRALVCSFWKTPYHKKLIHWGRELHDKFMLEYFIRSDFNQVIDYLHQAGYAVESSWFDAFFEYRFPIIGTFNTGDIRLELRWALEPWHVLGEEVTSVGTARYVDSSVERVQIKLSGWHPDRYLLSCNGTIIPVKSTASKGIYVTGLRYKAWSPPSALHPTIEVDTPLVFDVIDTWNNKSIGGCTYHVAHPGGRNYDTIPVNAYEAEARRHARFNPEGHTPGHILFKQESTGTIGRIFSIKDEIKDFIIPTAEMEMDLGTTYDLRKRKRKG